LNRYKNSLSDSFVVVAVCHYVGVSRASGVRAPWNGAVSEWRPFGMADPNLRGWTIE